MSYGQRFALSVLACGRWSILLGTVIVLWSVGAVVAADRPNIVWITCEDLSPHLGCYGDKLAITPTLDELASEGVRYTQAFAHAGVCAPARSGLVTGIYPNLKQGADFLPWLLEHTLSELER